ncbi:TPA: DUF551 domain-containing protein [Klebsiella variicola subsp. variicola]
MNHTLSDSQLEAMIKSAVNSSGPLPPDEKFSQLISALRELQERRKADSEPVAEVVSIYGDPEAFGEREIRPLVGIQQMPYGTKLYRHVQPEQVVPEEVTPDSIEILASARRRDHAVFQWDEDQRNAAADSWNAFRAAMLQELKKSAGTEAICRSDENVQVLHTKSPAQSDCCPAQNQGWIPVSERMPEDRISVILWDAEIGEVTSGHYSHKTQTFYHCGDAIENEITHWMPPPCAPQEVK